MNTNIYTIYEYKHIYTLWIQTYIQFMKTNIYTINEYKIGLVKLGPVSATILHSSIFYVIQLVLHAALINYMYTHSW